MVATGLSVGVFLHSLSIYDLERDNLDDAIATANRRGLNLIQLGPVSDAYLGPTNTEKRGGLVKTLNDENVNVGPLCVCYESGKGRGGQEKYGSIDEIADTGGYGHTDLDIVQQRIALTKDHIDLARFLKDQGVMSSDRVVLTTHVGFFDREDKREQIKDAVKEVVKYCEQKEKDVYLAIETGSERMEDLVGFIREIEEETGIKGRLGINFDPANFYLYGTQDPLEALHYLKQGDNKRFLFGVHAKDADRGELIGRAEGKWDGKGREVPVGIGSVDWHKTVALLYALDYTGPLIIERETVRPKYIGDQEFVEWKRSDISYAKMTLDLAQTEALKNRGEVHIPFG